MKKIIEFEDHGQDFLRWTLDDTGKVIDCQPFQARMWCESQVINHADLAPGDCVMIVRRKGDEPMTIRYPLTAVQKNNTVGHATL